MREKLRLLAGLVLIAIVIGSPIISRAEEKEKLRDYVATVYNEQNGLPTGEANTVIQTSDGYIWIGSYGGLIRYDGTDFINFSRPEDGISSSSVRALFEDSKGRLWVGTNDAGIFVYEKGTFSKIQGPDDYSFRCIRDFQEDAEGVVYAASTSGLGRIEEGRLIIYEEEQLQGKTVYSLGVDNYNRVWAAMDYGKCLVVEDGKAVAEISSDMLFDRMDIYCVASGTEGEIYLGTSENKVAKLTFSDASLLPEKWKVTFFSTQNVRTHNKIVVQKNGDVLISGLQGFGILTKDGAFLEFGEENEAVSVNWAELDYEGNIWLASSGLGLVKYTRAAFYTPNTVAGLSGKAINTIEEFDGFYYVGTDNGLYLFDAEWKQQKNKLTESLQNVRIRHIKAASDGLVYIATYYDYGLICYDPFKEGITAYSTENGLVDDGVRVILPLSDGRVAVGTQKGISILEDGKVTENYGSKEGMDTLSILCLVQGSDGTLYAGSDGSGIYAIKDGIVSTYGFQEGLQEGVVLRMLEDKNGGFFVSAGSNLYYWKDQVFTSLSDFQKGAGSIFDFYLKDGKLWLLQNSGVIAVDAEALLAGEKTNAEVFSFSLGLTGSLNANTWHKVCEDGSLMLATRNGISVFAFKGVEGQPPFVVLNEVKVDEEVYRAPEEIRLSKNAKRITFDFSMLSYNDPDKYQMACYLEGAEDDEHIYTEEKSAEISYTNLSGGEYIFRLKVYRLGEEKEIYEYQIPVYKDRRLTEYWLFWLVSAVLFVLLVALVMAGSFSLKMRRIQKRHKEYQEIVNQSLETFAKTIDAKDTYTNGHSARVAAYSREIAVRMGLSSEEQENVYYIALMHDIGKIGIPDSILKKQSELTEEEWEIVKKHPVIGGEILKDFTALEGIADGARYHHERFDGKGYCVGIKGEEIPLVARIIGIADAFDAMATTRFYRKAMDITEILKELERGSGTQFDPEILPIMLEMVKDGTVTIE